MYSKSELKDVKLVHEENRYYLDLTFECEDERSIYMLNIPKVWLPLTNEPILNIDPDRHRYGQSTLRFFDEFILPIEKDKNGALFSKFVIKEKTHKMTVAEIEKKLGYKIEIVSDK